MSASAFATPAIIGGRRLKVAATLAYDEFLNTLNWPLGAAVAVLLLVAAYGVSLTVVQLTPGAAVSVVALVGIAGSGLLYAWRLGAGGIAD